MCSCCLFWVSGFGVSWVPSDKGGSPFCLGNECIPNDITNNLRLHYFSLNYFIVSEYGCPECELSGNISYILWICDNHNTSELYDMHLQKYMRIG